MFITLIQNVLKYLIYTIATPIAAIMFAYAGYLYMTAGDEMGNIKKAHDIFVSVLWGFGVMLIAWALVWFIITFFTGDNSEYNLLQAPNAAAQAQP
jgi:riboflavin transporter FmnP